jgi:2-haloacid dehalogenase
MPINRRAFIHGSMATAAAALFSHTKVASASAPRFKALAFDAFPIFDPRPVFALARLLYPDKGIELGNAWRIRQFEYQWLRAMSGTYADFWQVTEDALIFSAKLLDIELSAAMRSQLMNAYLELKAWSDVAQNLALLGKAGVRLAFLSNATEKILQSGIRNSGLDGIFEHVISTDRIRTYKPDPRAYQMAVDMFGLKKEEIGFVAFAGWDAAGAKAFGYPTFWANRLNMPAEELGVTADATGQTLADLVRFATTWADEPSAILDSGARLDFNN